MRRPLNTNLVPAGGWSVTIPNAGPEIRAWNWIEFIVEIRKRLEANNLDVHDWKARTIDLMCQQRPDIEQEDMDEPVTRTVTGDDLKRFVVAMYETWKEGAVAVDHAEQDRRASICASCPKRINVSCMGGCGRIAEALSEMIIGCRAKVYPELHKTSCGVCSCECSTIVMFPLEILQKVDAKTKFPVGQFPAHCWRYPKTEAEKVASQV